MDSLKFTIRSDKKVEERLKSLQQKFKAKFKASKKGANVAGNDDIIFCWHGWRTTARLALFSFDRSSTLLDEIRINHLQRIVSFVTSVCTSIFLRVHL